jgi:hypothetical protein
MFSGAIAFNQPLDRWDVRNVYDTERMFEGATAFQQQTSLRTWGSKKSFPGDRRVTQSYQQNHLVEERRWEYIVAYLHKLLMVKTTTQKTNCHDDNQQQQHSIGKRKKN